MNEYAVTNVKTTEPKPSVAEEVIKAQRILLDRVGQIEDRMRNLLSSVMVPECPAPDEPKTGIDPEWPPLFSELREINRSTNQTLTRINILLDRVRI